MVQALVPWLIIVASHSVHRQNLLCSFFHVVYVLPKRIPARGIRHFPAFPGYEQPDFPEMEKPLISQRLSIVTI